MHACIDGQDSNENVWRYSGHDIHSTHQNPRIDLAITTIHNQTVPASRATLHATYELHEHQ